MSAEAGLVLVTGGSGMIGRAVIQRLLDAGHPVRALVRQHSLPGALAGRVEVVRGDVTCDDDCGRAVHGAEAVVHLAGLAHRVADTSRFQEINAGGSERLSRAAAAAGVERMILMSSLAVHGAAPGWIAENSPVNPDTPYGESKLEAERRTRRVLGSSGPRLVILRPSVVYGEGDPGNTMRLVRAIDRRRFVLIGGGVRKSMTHVDNVADIVLLALETPAAEGVYVVADPHPYPLREVVERIASALGRGVPSAPVPKAFIAALAAATAGGARAVGRSSPISPRDVEVWFRDTLAQPDRLEREMGYTARVGLAEGIRRMVSAYRRQGA